MYLHNSLIIGESLISFFPLWVWIFQQVGLLHNLFFPFLFGCRQFLQIQFEPFTNKRQRRLRRVAVRAGSFINSLQKFFQRVVLRKVEKIVLVGYPKVEDHHITAKAVLVMWAMITCLNRGRSCRDCTVL